MKLIYSVAYSILLMLFSFNLAWAVNVANLYQAELTVASQTEELKEQAVQDGLLQVLVKVSGNAQINENPVIKAGLKKAAYYVQEYNYLPPTRASSQYVVQIRYEPNDIRRLLHSAGVAYWGKNRPLILVWLTVVSEHRDAEIISEGTLNHVMSYFKLQAKKYGLPLIFPVMDMQDLSQITVNDITQATLPVLQEAAKRYAPDAILISSVDDDGKGIEGRWQLVLGGQKWNGSVSQPSLDQAITLIMDEVNQVLVKRYDRF